MYRRFLVLFLLVPAGCSDDAARDQGSFGFSIDVPDNWIVLSRAEIRENPDLFDGLSIEGVSPEMMKEFRTRVESGSVEMYLREEDGVTFFADNVNVIKQVQVLPKTAAELKKVQEALAAEFEKAFGRRLELYESRLAEVGESNAVFFEFEGVVPNTRSMQYQIAKSKSVALIFTATCKEATVDEVRPEFEAMIKSIRFK
jgi:hypothetical protein